MMLMKKYLNLVWYGVLAALVFSYILGFVLKFPDFYFNIIYGFYSVGLLFLLTVVTNLYAEKTAKIAEENKRLAEATEATLKQMKERERKTDIQNRLEKLYSPIIHNEGVLKNISLNYPMARDFVLSIKPYAYLASEELYPILKDFIIVMEVTTEHSKHQEAANRLLKKCQEEYDALVKDLNLT